MIALERVFAAGRDRAAHLSNPFVLKIAVWLVVLAWGASIAVHWLRDAAATLPPPAVTPPRPAIDLDAAIAAAKAAPLFGEAVTIETAPTAVAVPLDIKLKGVLAGGGGPIAAIVNTGGEEDEVVMLGAELRPGVVLEGVHPTHVIVGREGGSHRVELEPVRSDPSRSKTAPRGTPRPAHGPPMTPSTPDAEVTAPPAEAESATPLAPPMPRSEAPSDPHSRSA